VKSKLVDKTFQHQIGTTIYTLSLKSETLFLFCLLGAEKIKEFSYSKCDEIITHALQNYAADADFIKFAVGL
jgi:hypothetical protein